MAINVPADWTKWGNGIPKAFYDILALEGAQNALPVDMKLVGGSLGAYAVLQTIDHAIEHSWGGSIIYGLLSAALVGVSTFLVVPRYDTREKTIQTTIALAGVGAIIALTSIILHFVFSVALPPPLPTERLVNFLLFPLTFGTSSPSPTSIDTRSCGRSRPSPSRRRSSSSSTSSWRNSCTEAGKTREARVQLHASLAMRLRQQRFSAQ